MLSVMDTSRVLLGILCTKLAEERPLPRWSSRTLTLFRKDKILMTAPEGMHTGQFIFQGKKAKIAIGNVLPLSEIPEGTSICNIESAAGDRGTMVRASGNYAIVVSHDQDKGVTRIRLPSGSKKTLINKCRAMIGIVAGGGRTDKPMLKAGRASAQIPCQAQLLAFRERCRHEPVEHLMVVVTSSTWVTPELFAVTYPPVRRPDRSQLEELVESRAQPSVRARISKFIIYTMYLIVHQSRFVPIYIPCADIIHSQLVTRVTTHIPVDAESCP